MPSTVAFDRRRRFRHHGHNLTAEMFRAVGGYPWSVLIKGADHHDRVDIAVMLDVEDLVEV